MAEKIAVIAVIDDEPAVRRALKRLLRSAGFDVHTYSGGADFLQAMQARPAECVVVDIQMRSMDGFGVLERLKSLGIGVPAILMTAYETSADDARVGRSGAIGFLRKPFSDDALIEMVQAALRSPIVDSRATSPGP